MKRAVISLSHVATVRLGEDSWSLLDRLRFCWSGINLNSLGDSATGWMPGGITGLKKENRALLYETDFY